MPKSRYVLFPLIVMATLLFQLAMPVVARADDGVPPPDQPTAEVVPDPGTDPSLTEAVSTDATTTETTPDPGTDATQTEAVSTEAVATDAAPTDVPLMAQVPEGTEVVVLNADGTIEPLATQAAADAIAAGDPVWCPATLAAPTPGANGCSDSYSDLASLISALPSSDPYVTDPSLAGIIWIEAGSDGSSAGIVIDGGNFTNMDNYSLTLQGGWDGTSGSAAIIGQSTLTVPLIISNWNAGVTINDILSNGSTGYGLDVSTTGDITLSNVDVIGADFDGAYLVNNAVGSTSSVSVGNSTFTGNAGIGVQVYTNGTITLNTVDASTNAQGAVLSSYNTDTMLPDPAISITGSTFNDNTFEGLYADATAGDVTLNNVTASNTTPPGPQQYGAIVKTAAGNVQVTGGAFNNNTTGDPEYPGIGLEASTHLGNITLNGVTAKGNDIGAMAGTEQGNVLIQGGNFSGNLLTGLATGTMSGNVTLTDVVANGTTDPEGVGALVFNLNGPISISATALGNSTFDANGAKGLWVGSATGTVTLTDIEASGNGVKGAYIEYVAPCGSTGGIIVTIDGGIYQSNGAFGIYALVGPAGSVTVTGSPTFGDNGGATGLSIYDLYVNNSVCPCPPPKPEPTPESKPYNIVNVPETGGEPVEQNCTDYSGTVLILPDGDKAILTCPSAGGLTLTSLSQSNLPGTLPQGPEFVSAMQFGLTDGGQPVTVLTDGGVLKLAFKLPEDARPSDHYAILYWDPTAKNGAGDWVELPKFMAHLDGSPLAFVLHPDLSPDDGMRILSGTRVYGDYVKAMVNFTGVFVLVKK